MGFKEAQYGCVEWIQLAQDSAHWQVTCENSNEPSGSLKVWEFFDLLIDQYYLNLYYSPCSLPVHQLANLFI